MNAGDEKSAVDLCHWMERRAREFERKRMHRESIHYWSKLLKALTHSRSADVSRLAAIHYRIGLNHQALKENTKSIYHLKYSIRLDASVPRYYEAFGKAFLRGGHLEVARAQFERAVKLDPQNPSYLRQYSTVLLLSGKLPEARLYARRAVELKPQDPKLLWNLARIYFESRMPFHALSVAKRLPMNAVWGARAKHLKDECAFHIEQTLEGQVMRHLRRGMRMDGQPFHLQHYRLAEQLWIDYSLTENPARSRRIKPNVWAGALSLISYNILSESSGSAVLDEILGRFSTDSSQVWPAVSKIGQYMECRGFA